MAASRNTKGLRTSFNFGSPANQIPSKHSVARCRANNLPRTRELLPAMQIMRRMGQAISVVLTRAVGHIRAIVCGLEGPYHSRSTVHPGNWRITTPSSVIPQVRSFHVCAEAGCISDPGVAIDCPCPGANAFASTVARVEIRGNSHGFARELSRRPLELYGGGTFRRARSRAAPWGRRQFNALALSARRIVGPLSRRRLECAGIYALRWPEDRQSRLRDICKRAE